MSTLDVYEFTDPSFRTSGLGCIRSFPYKHAVFWCGKCMSDKEQEMFKICDKNGWNIIKNRVSEIVLCPRCSQRVDVHKHQ